ncbi:MAG: universal stress protein [Acidimicrobiia bacterium]|nr:universal stress protein [Acidimicrobiia bacterium]
MFSMSRILVPVDFSARSTGAARYAEALAEHYGSKVTMLHVLPPPHYEFTALEGGALALGEWYGTRKENVQEELVRHLSEHLPELQAERLILQGDPARRICEFAEKGADLIVISTHGYGPFRRFILGSVTTKILHDAHCPVWTGVHMEDAPAVDRIHFSTVMAAVDLGPESEKAIGWALEFARTQKAKLILVHATPSLEGSAGEYFDPNWRGVLRRQATARLTDLLQKLGGEADIMVEAGDVPYVVDGLARERKADLLVIGRGSVAGVFGRLRANAYAIIRNSPCPVVSV